ncbi:hypothetical protein N7513_001324 [Penicillium frequentans]|uniref:Uncharacterized protein n=1 Tax=Penicillium frequentans TaxID=3151616 RepID=A0AAD6CPA2_9EURO|nr:hypothetical protein N7494_008842 [Penicillium glabrum]KAJ5565082.1 hypothetical protein N7513_001324 [Penicillium glabrum]
MSDSPNDNERRHWHGAAGDRYEHVNAWTAGGAKGPTSRAAWALTPEMMANLNARKNSDASTSSNTGNTANQSGSPAVPSVGERRRSSASSPGGGGSLFSNLQSQKRDSTDPSMAGRRASWNEQQAQGGYFSKLWNGYTRGK